MRKTKFRAWDKQRKQMLHDGDYWSAENRQKGNSSICYQILVMNHGVRWCKKYPSPMPEGAFEFDRMTMEDLELMEYTGLKDKNGIEIYEGDLLRWIDWEQELTETPDLDVVIYLNSEARFAMNTFRDGKHIGTGDEENRYLLGMDEFEVIGNIYENPELLEAKS
ncbi:YopX family protein [Pseudarthrobacter sp. HLT3-5]|uniref:YopX family protein n=1 Tax=Pseudarthrobacter cellobiosi TaxID=2953654 RepID=UPI00208F81C3|nr:YopX family protein [Pseudarthrobacter sp. HLT3-5]MCO4274294.1 YopX family protein [Pseudarthrobacter sp. HLT3-5]